MLNGNGSSSGHSLNQTLQMPVVLVRWSWVCCRAAWISERFNFGASRQPLYVKAKIYKSYILVVSSNLKNMSQNQTENQKRTVVCNRYSQNWRWEVSIQIQWPFLSLFFMVSLTTTLRTAGLVSCRAAWLRDNWPTDNQIFKTLLTSGWEVTFVDRIYNL